MPCLAGMSLTSQTSMQAKSQERGLQLHTAILLPSCQSFCQFMTDLRTGSLFTVQIAVIWAIERAYNEVRSSLVKDVAAVMTLPCADRLCRHA